MKLTIEKALNMGVIAHREGKLQEAERYYRSVLQSEPLHPDANHNLGVLAVSFNKVRDALPLFKTALEANPNLEQFWLSYIEALIKEQQFENAKKVIKHGKQRGIDVKKLNSLLALLSHTSREEKVDGLSPSQQELRNLLEQYNAGRFDDAEKLATSITKQYPSHQFSWDLLGALFQQTGRINESLTARKKSVEIVPQDAVAHSNLGITLKELGRLEDAEASFTQAIVLKKDYAEAHYNLGITLKELGKLEEAAANFTKASLIQPDNPQFYLYRGLTPALMTRQSLTSRDDVMQFINQGDWANSEGVLRQLFAQNNGDISSNITEFIRLWCIFCRKLIKENEFKRLIPIFVNLFVMFERNNDVNKLTKRFFESFDIDKILKFVKTEHKILIFSSFCHYNYLNEKFEYAESIAIRNIQKAENLIRINETEDLGWLVVRRSLASCKRKDVAKTALDNLISNLIE